MLTKSRPDPLPISDTDLVLDIGGGMNPHPRADYVLDLKTYTDAKCYGNPEKIGRFSSETWIVHDLCSSKPFPFPDQYFDFAICTHLLEDVRDPVRVCEEMLRVAKAGYIEVPSVESELTRNLESYYYVGRWHHRWLVEINEEGLLFRYKPHFVNGYWKTQIPRSWWKNPPESDIQGLVWRENFCFNEVHYSYNDLLIFIEDFVRERQVYSRFSLSAWEFLRTIKKQLKGNNT